MKGHNFSSLGVIYDLNPTPPYTFVFVRLFSEAVSALKSRSNHIFPPFFFFPLHLLCTPALAHFNGRDQLPFAACSTNPAWVPGRAGNCRFERRFLFGYKYFARFGKAYVALSL